MPVSASLTRYDRDLSKVSVTDSYRSLNASILSIIFASVIVGGEPASLGSVAPPVCCLSIRCNASVGISVLVIGVNGVLDAIRTNACPLGDKESYFPRLRCPEY